MCNYGSTKLLVPQNSHVSFYCTKFDDLVKKRAYLNVENPQTSCLKISFKIWLRSSITVYHRYIASDQPPTTTRKLTTCTDALVKSLDGQMQRLCVLVVNSQHQQPATSCQQLCIYLIYYSTVPSVLVAKEASASCRGTHVLTDTNCVLRLKQNLTRF